MRCACLNCVRNSMAGGAEYHSIFGVCVHERFHFSRLYIPSCFIRACLLRCTSKVSILSSVWLLEIFQRFHNVPVSVPVSELVMNTASSTTHDQAAISMPRRRDDGALCVLPTTPPFISNCNELQELRSRDKSSIDSNFGGYFPTQASNRDLAFQRPAILPLDQSTSC